MKNSYVQPFALFAAVSVVVQPHGDPHVDQRQTPAPQVKRVVVEANVSVGAMFVPAPITGLTGVTWILPKG